MKGDIYVMESKMNEFIKITEGEGEYDRKCIFAKAMFKYVLFYYKQQDKNREKLENYVQYLEKIKKCMGER